MARVAHNGYGQQANPLSQYLVMVRERMWYVVLSILVFVTAALIYTVNATPEYRVHLAKVLVRRALETASA